MPFQWRNQFLQSLEEGAGKRCPGRGGKLINVFVGQLGTWRPVNALTTPDLPASARSLVPSTASHLCVRASNKRETEACLLCLSFTATHTS